MSRPDSRPVGTEIKRSSWSAGMAIDPAVPPPGSPAAWQGKARGRGGSSSSANKEEIPQLGAVPQMSAIQSFNNRRSPSPGRYLKVPSSISGRTLSPIRSVSGTADAPYDPEDDEEDYNDARGRNVPILNDKPPENEYNPFKFTPTYVTPGLGSPARTGAGGATLSAAQPSQRRGHRYKHSSVSMNFFQEPEERAPLAIPVSLAIPTFSEYWQSLTRAQLHTLAWCVVRIAIAVGIYAAGSPMASSVATLAHLVAYETVVNTAVTGVEILANFDVWRRSSLRLPFALKRVEVLVAFALAVILMFTGGDVISHTIQDIATGHEGHDASSHGGHAHHGDEHGGGLVQHYVVALLAIAVVLPPAIIDGSLLATITAAIGAVVLLVPVLPAGSIIDALLTPAIAVTMVWLGWRSSKQFGGMLAMSYGGPDNSETISALVSSDPSVVEVSDISLWQVHDDLWLAGMRVTMSGTLSDERRVRDSAVKAIQKVMDAGEAELETTIDITRVETDTPASANSLHSH